ncbi:MAG: hypothetical protein EP322_05285 [Bacteroidetes bacterium]|nr:MAG: hypothetical protein EP322_05285 [Bacteroidota bacterium]
MSDDILDLKPESQNKRPVFLLVLCILTFVGAGFGTLGALFNLFTIGQIEETYQQMSDTMSSLGSDMGMNFEDSYKWTKISYYLNLLGNAMCLAGALFMFKLRKIGYYIYIPGQVLPIVGAYMAFNSVFSGGFLAGIGMVSIAFSALFSIGFIIMYGLNFKHMH